MEFTDIQHDFMAYIRDQSQVLPVNTDTRHMAVYQTLCLNNIDNMVSHAYPVLRSLYCDKAWLARMTTFFRQHDCKSPLFIEIATEFLQFLQFEYLLTDDDPIFMQELAHYEWLELAIAVAGQDNRQYSLNTAQIERLPLCLSTTAKVAQYHYPVHRISRAFQPTKCEPQPIFFCVYQDSNFEVCFLQLNPLTAQVLEWIAQQGKATLGAILKWLAMIYPQMALETLKQGCITMLAQLAVKGIVRRQCISTLAEDEHTLT